MNFVNIFIITFIITFAFYIFFTLLGVGGIAKNRKAQGLDQKLNE